MTNRSAKMAGEVRIEKDLLGEKLVPRDAYYGIQTARAVENFPITGTRLHPELIKAIATVKKAAARANMGAGLLAARIGEAIAAAATEVIEGGLRDQFLIDALQGGAGTSANMNANEVIANRAIEILGGEKGDYELVSPHNHVNLSQSTNDVVPTALRIAALWGCRRLVGALQGLGRSLESKAAEFDGVLKVGRTHLQDAVPIRLGQEFAAYSAAVRRGRARIVKASEAVSLVNMGATAVGTGLNADREYIRLVVDELRRLTDLGLKPVHDLVDGTQNLDPFVELSGALKVLAVSLSKISGDLRLMASGPRCGLSEISLPEVQPGSSIMPGKVNPVIPEVVNQVCLQVFGNDLTISMAAEAGQLELNVMFPVLARNLLESLDALNGAVRALDERCIGGITADAERCREMVERSVGLVTALNPYIGYESAQEIAREAVRTGRPVREIALSAGVLDAETLDRILSPRQMTEPKESVPQADPG